MKKNFNHPLLGCAALMHRIATRFTLAMTVIRLPYVIASEARQSGATRFKHPQLAFSLVELLISLIVISVITAAFAPVVSKKLRHGKISISQSTKKLSADCTSIHANCRLCYEKETTCLLCLVNCASGEYPDNSTCVCKSCGSVFPNCAGCSATKCSKCKPGYGLSGNTCTQCAAGTASDGSGACYQCNGTRQYSPAGASSCSTCETGKKPNAAHTACENITCPTGQYLPSGSNDCKNCTDTYPNCAKCDSSACQECNLGTRKVGSSCKAMVKPKGQTDCDKFNAIFVPFVSGSGSSTVVLNEGVCVTKRNAGDDGGPTIEYGSITRLTAGTGKTNPACASSTTPCCWAGAGTTMTAKSADKDAAGNVTTRYCDESTIGNVKVGSKYPKFDYKSCKRTVCNYAAAKIACENYSTEKTARGDWKLPNSSVVSAIEKIVAYKDPCKDGDDSSKYLCSGPKFVAASAISYIQNYKGAAGLQLCAGGSSVQGIPRCYILGKACKGAYFSTEKGTTDCCVPNAVWADGKRAFSLIRGYLSNNSSWVYYYESDSTTKSGSYNEGSAFSTRCVLYYFPED